MQRAKGGGDFCLSVAPSVKFYVNALMHADSNCSFPQIRRSKILLITSVTPFFPKTKVFISAFFFFFFRRLNRTLGTGSPQIKWIFYKPIHKFLHPLATNDTSLTAESECGNETVHIFKSVCAFIKYTTKHA